MRFPVLLITFLFAGPLAAETLAIKGGSLFDPHSAKMQVIQAIVIEGDKIVSIGTPAKPVEIPRTATVIDASGKFLIPGLIDAHVHLVHRLNFAHITGDEILPYFLANGVTSVRDTGDEIVAQTLVARFAEKHPEICPRVFTCSHLMDSNPPTHLDIGLPITDPAKVPAVLDDQLAWKITTLKIYVGTSRPVGRRLIEEGHKRKLFVTGHLSNYRAQDAIEDGIDCLEHITTVFDFCFTPEELRKPNPRTAIDLANQQATGLITLLAKKHVMVDPTLTVFKNMLLLSDLDAVNKHPDNAFMPERLRTYWDGYRQGQNMPRSTLGLREKELGKLQELTGLLYKAGVTLLVGTDAPEPYCPPGYSLHQEMELMVQSGVPTATVLQSATLNNARALKQESRLGSIEVGKLADLVVLSSDPLVNIKNTRQIEHVIHGGLVCNPEKVRKAGSR